MYKKIYFAISTLVFIGLMYFAVITFQPISSVTSEEVRPISGKVTTVEKVQGGHIRVELEGDTHQYYIRKAYQKKVDFQHFYKNTFDHQVVLYHVYKWTPFTTDYIHPHISKVTVNGMVLFNELIDEKK